MKKFEGQLQANQFAEIESKKQNKELWVFKSLQGGLSYYVSDKGEPTYPGDKKLNHYNKGIIQK